MSGTRCGVEKLKMPFCLISKILLDKIKIGQKIFSSQSHFNEQLVKNSDKPQTKIASSILMFHFECSACRCYAFVRVEQERIKQIEGDGRKKIVCNYTSVFCVLPPCKFLLSKQTNQKHFRYFLFRSRVLYET